MSSIPEYTAVPPRAAQVFQSFAQDKDSVDARVAAFAHVKPREPDQEGSIEEFDGVLFTHHFTNAPGDYDVVNWHWVETGRRGNEVIVFLHGIPNSWYEWHHQMAALADRYHCIAIDLKGYGQSHKAAGDYRQEGAASQLVHLLDAIGVDRFNLVSQDRGTVQADFIAADHPGRVIRYGRGEQHLVHFNPVLAPQGEMLMNAPYSGVMEDARRFVLSAYLWIASRPVPDREMERLIQEFSYPGISRAVPRYYNSTTMRQEWLARRQRLMAAWTCPVMLIQGHDSKTQPREFYADVQQFLPNARRVTTTFIQAGHFWCVEAPDETTRAIEALLKL